MKRRLNERVKDFFIRMGRCNKILRLPAIIGLAITMLLYRFCEYCRKGTKRFACTIFILCCFMVGSSFSFPVFQEENGFISGNEKESGVIAADASDITLAAEPKIAYDELEVPDDDVFEGYEDAGLHGMDNYIFDENLNNYEEDGQINPEKEMGEDALQMQEEDNKSEKTQAEFEADDWKLVLINKQHPIPDDYTFTLGKVKTIKGEMQCDERIIDELLAMKQAAGEDGVRLEICSPYRDFAWQEVLFNSKVKAYMNKGMSYMEAYKISSQAVTVPGASEHQIGLAIDFISDTYTDLDEGFAQTSAGIWLKEHCAEYGFVLRYPQGKEYITSIEYEPWHFRYVGKEAAKVIMEEGLCLEEFWDKYL